MKLSITFFLLMAVILLYSCQKEEINPQLNLPTGSTFLSASDSKDARKPTYNYGGGNQCLTKFEKECLKGEKFVVGTFEIVEPLDIINYCNNKYNNGELGCSVEECNNRLNVLFHFAVPTDRNSCFYM